jgi:hypothetical protein
MHWEMVLRAIPGDLTDNGKLASSHEWMMQLPAGTICIEERPFN